MRILDGTKVNDWALRSLDPARYSPIGREYCSRRNGLPLPRNDIHEAIVLINVPATACGISHASRHPFVDIMSASPLYLYTLTVWRILTPVLYVVVFKSALLRIMLVASLIGSVISFHSLTPGSSDFPSHSIGKLLMVADQSSLPWSVATTKVLDRSTLFVGRAKLNSIGTRKNYWHSLQPAARFSTNTPVFSDCTSQDVANLFALFRLFGTILLTTIAFDRLSLF